MVTASGEGRQISVTKTLANDVQFRRDGGHTMVCSGMGSVPV
jgi:hypothetical protein